MATGNQVDVGLSGSSGTGSFAGTTSPVFTTPALGTPSSGTLTSCTGLPAGGIVGTSNGGIFYSNASTAAILTATTTAQQLLLSGASTTPQWSTTTYPLTNAINTLLFASSANVMGALATANSSVLVTSGAGLPSLSTTLPSGIAATNMSLTTPTIGAAIATSIQISNTGIIDTNAKVALAFSATTNAVNGFTLTNSATTVGPTWGVTGSDTNINVNIASKGIGEYLFGTNTVVFGQTASIQRVQFATNSQRPVVTFGGYGGTALPPIQVFANSRSSTIGSFTILQTNDIVGQIQWNGDDGAALTESAKIVVTAVGTISAGVVPGKMQFYTAAAGGTDTLAATIDQTQTLTLANALPVASGGTGITSFGTGVATALGTNVNGSGAFALTTSAVLVTPTLGAATATSLAFSPTTGGIIGTTAADNAAAGKVGELLSSANATAVAMTTATVTQIQSLSLTAGDWDVWGAFYTAVTGTTVNSIVECQLHPTTATIVAPTTAQLTSIASLPGLNVTGQATYLNTGISRWNVSGATNVFLNATATYSASTLTGNGAIYARRVR